MTHGPKPKKAIDEAWRIAAGRGTVLNVSMMQGLAWDLLLFTGTQVVFIRVKRIRTHSSDPREIEHLFKEAVRSLRDVPMDPVTCREVHALAPWGAWQYFRVDNDRVTEVRRDGTPVMQAGTEPGRVNTGAGPV